MGKCDFWLITRLPTEFTGQRFTGRRSVDYREKCRLLEKDKRWFRLPRFLIPLLGANAAYMVIVITQSAHFSNLSKETSKSFSCPKKTFSKVWKTKVGEELVILRFVNLANSLDIGNSFHCSLCGLFSTTLFSTSKMGFLLM